MWAGGGRACRREPPALSTGPRFWAWLRPARCLPASARAGPGGCLPCSCVESLPWSWWWWACNWCGGISDADLSSPEPRGPLSGAPRHPLVRSDVSAGLCPGLGAGAPSAAPALGDGAAGADRRPHLLRCPGRGGRRAPGLCAVLQSRPAAGRAELAVSHLGGGHVLPRWVARRGGGDAVVQPPDGAGPRGAAGFCGSPGAPGPGSGPVGQLHRPGAVGAAHQPALGHGVSCRPPGSAPPSLPALSVCPRGVAAVCRALVVCRPASPALVHRRIVSAALRRPALSGGVRPGARRAHRPGAVRVDEPRATAVSADDARRGGAVFLGLAPARRGGAGVAGVAAALPAGSEVNGNLGRI